MADSALPPDSTLPPDFNGMSLSFQELSVQTKRLGNLPSMDGGAQILQTLHAMQQQTTQQFQQINQRLDTMQHQMDSMQHQMDSMQSQMNQIVSSMDGIQRENTARDANHLAAIENGLLSSGDGRLQPLHSMETGEVIADFPAVVADVDRLTDAETRRILRELRLNRDGVVRERRRRILLATGATGVRHLNAV